jgi:hypothetical protein
MWSDVSGGYAVVHPTKEEYAHMDGIRFPFILKKENQIKERQYRKFCIIKDRRLGSKDRTKLEERIKKLILENKERFFDPIIGKEIQPICKRNKGGWDKCQPKS